MHLRTNLERGIIVDSCDLHLLGLHLWSTSSGYAMSKVGEATVYLHRLILITDLDVDHINRNKLDNRRTNLREATRSQNLLNRSTCKDTASGYKGVYKKRNNWIARIRVNNTTLNLGTFLTKEEAAMNYDLAAMKHHGKFAQFNFSLEIT